jgi:hypothetical protein
MLRSGLALAGANTWLQHRPLPSKAEDGILTAGDVSAPSATPPFPALPLLLVAIPNIGHLYYRHRHAVARNNGFKNIVIQFSFNQI